MTATTSESHAARALASRLRRTLTGPMWHGPAVMELLRSVDAEQALRRPVEGAHTIWELVHHMTAWANIARLRIDGLALEYPDTEEDWPPTPAYADPEAWTRALQRLSDSYEALAHMTKGLTDAQLRAKVAKTDYSVETMICGVVEHGVYHGGQMAILRAERQSPESRVQSPESRVQSLTLRGVFEMMIEKMAMSSPRLSTLDSRLWTHLRALCSLLFTLSSLAACAPDPTPQPRGTNTDSAFAAVQERGRDVMGVDQYTSQHVFEDLPDGGRVILDRADSTDIAAIEQIRSHMRDIEADFTAGNFSKPFGVHAQQVPGTDVMAARRETLRYSVVDRPRGAELRISTSDSLSLAAVRAFLAFQRMDHRAAGHEGHSGH